VKVLVALASSSGQLSGVPRHALNLARCLLSRHEISEVHLVAAPWQQGFVLESTSSKDTRLHLHTAPIGNSALSRNLWFYRQLPALATHLDADIVHLAYPVPIRRSAFHCPTVVTLHDLYPYDIPENFGFPKALFNRLVLRTCLDSVDAVACVSQSTLTRLREIDPRLTARKARVIYNSLEARAQGAAETAIPELGTEPFLLCVAQHRSNKNIPLALRVFAQLTQAKEISNSSRLLIVGISGPETAVINSVISTLGIGQRVILINGISDEQLQWCYRNCILLLAPSIVEGFGLPVAEALLAGCRVVCSDIPAFRELSGNRCRRVPLGPRSIDAFVEAVRLELGATVPKPVELPQLSAPVVAEGYMQLYRSLINPQGVKAASHQSAFSSLKERNHRL
jgi:glycosyltransferase involved in cell wall biosynthesis